MGKTLQPAGRSDAEIAEEVLRQKLLTPGQLKAALDYQASVGGELVDVMRKLGLVADDVLDAFIDDLASSHGEGNEKARAAKTLPIDPAKIRVHRKLLEKVPREIVERYGILFFFPPPGTRAILMSCESSMGADGLQRLQSLLGVEIRMIDLPPSVRERWLDEVTKRKDRGHSHTESGLSDRGATESGLSDRGATGSGLADRGATGSGLADRGATGSGLSNRRPTESGEVRDPFRGATRPAASQKASGSGRDMEMSDDRALMRGLAQLLVKKGIIAWDEIAVEVELVKRAQNRVKNDKTQRPTEEER